MNKKALLVFGVVLVVAIVVMLVVYFSNPPTDNNPPEEPQQEITLEITCPTKIEMYITDSFVEIPVQVTTNATTEVDINYTITNDKIISILNNKITPLNVGSTNIIVKASCQTKTVSRQIEIIVYSSPYVEAFTFMTPDHNIVERLFYGGSHGEYLLKVEFTYALGDFYIEASGNIFDLIVVQKTNQIAVYSFKIMAGTEACFVFNHSGTTFEKSIKAYEYINNFEINFNRSQDKTKPINLFLFNSDFELQANADGVYNNIEMHIILKTNNLPEFDIFCDDTSVISLTNNFAKSENHFVITAKKQGQCAITVVAKDGSLYSEVIIVKVEKVMATTIQTEAEIYLEINQTHQFNPAILPIYSLCKNYTVVGDNIDNNSFCSNATGIFVIKIVCESCNIFTECTVIVEDKSYQYIISVPSAFINDVLVFEYKNDVIYVQSSESYLLMPLEFLIKNSANELYSLSWQSYTLVESCTGLSVDFYSMSNSIMLEISGKGEIVFKIINIANTKIQKTLKIVIT